MQYIQQPQIPQLTPEEASRDMTPAEIRQLQETIKNVRKVIARFHDTRRRNNERMAGLRAAKMWPQQVQQVVHATREPAVEAQAVEQLRQFLRVLRGHEPTRQEMQEGIPEGLEQQMGMGGIPLAIGAVAVALGTSVYSIFSYLDNHEERIAQQTATPLERGLRALSDNIWGVAAVGAVVGGVYVYHRAMTAEEREHERRLRRIKEGYEEEELLENEEDASFIDKAKKFVRNGLFPAKNEPDVDELSSQYEKLSENDKDRFIEMINNLDGQEDEPEEIEENEEEEECQGCPGDSEAPEENPGDPEEESLEENEEEQDEPEEE